MTMTNVALGKYKHLRGIHCESACQSRILNALGLDVCEDLLFGLDGGFGFSYFPIRGSDPDVIVGKQGILPFKAMKLMGVEVRAHAPRSTEGLLRLLENTPAALIRVDLGMLPYWGLQGRTSFGGYVVNVIGRQGNDIVVSDCAFDEVQVVDSPSLEAARSSRKAAPLNPENRAYEFGAPRGTVKLDAIGSVAARNLCREVLRPGSRNLGIPGMRQLMKTAPTWPTSKVGDVEDADVLGKVVHIGALERQLLHFGRQIESFGTGGGLYRPMIERFLRRVAEATGDDRYLIAADFFRASGKLWSGLGQSLLALADDGSSDASTADLIDSVVRIVGEVIELETQAFDSLKRV